LTGEGSGQEKKKDLTILGRRRSRKRMRKKGGEPKKKRETKLLTRLREREKKNSPNGMLSCAELGNTYDGRKWVSPNYPEAEAGRKTKKRPRDRNQGQR